MPNFRRQRSKLIFLSILAIAGGISLAAILPMLGKDQQTRIITSEIHDVSHGKLTEGTDLAPEPGRIQTKDERLVYTSDEIVPEQKKANAAVLKWDSPEAKDGVSVQVRTYGNGKWSDWIDSDSEDRKDGTPPPNAVLALNDNISKVQYQVVLDGQNGQLSPEFNLDSTSVEMIDTTHGPDPTKKSAYKRVLEKVGLRKSAQARMDGPRIYSRAEWGSPEPDSSPNWTPEYVPLYRGIVHHTVSTSGSDTAATIRAIWQFHSITNGWGDIGYNYLVDTEGNIFQGRYFDPNDARTLKGDVVGGHALDHNRGTVGVAAIGDFSNVTPPDKMLDSIANIIAFRAADYGFNPSGIGPNGPNVIGHREVNSTACPGAKLFERLQTIRNVGDIYYIPRAAMNHFDLTNQGQGYNGAFGFETSMIAGETREAYFDLRNEGDDTWSNSGNNPVVLGTDMPHDRASPFFTSGSWINSNRPATFTQKVVTNPDGTKSLLAANAILPGEVARFKFTITAPEQPGFYREHYQLVVERSAWFTRNLLLSTNITVAPRIYSWRPTAQHIFTNDLQTTNYRTTDVAPGERVYLVVKALNTGNQTWYRDGTNPIRIGTSYGRDRISIFCDTTWINCNRPAGLTEASVAPGGTGTFGFWIKIPSNAQGYHGYEYFSLVVEGKAWINTEPGFNWPVSVNP